MQNSLVAFGSKLNITIKIKKKLVRWFQPQWLQMFVIILFLILDFVKKTRYTNFFLCF